MATKKTITHLSVVLGVSALAVSLPGQAVEKDLLGYTGLASQHLTTAIKQPVRTGLIGGEMLKRDMGLQANDMLVNNNIKLQDRKLINRDHMVRNTATQINTLGHMDRVNTAVKGETRWNSIERDTLRTRTTTTPALKGKVISNDMLGQRDLNNGVKADRLNTQGRDVLRTRNNDVLGQRDLTMIKGERRLNTLGQDSLRIRNINSQPLLKGKLLRDDMMAQRDLNSVKADRLNTQGRDVLRTRNNDMLGQRDLTMIKGERRLNTLGQDSLRIRNINSQPVLKGKLLRDDMMAQRDLNSVKADRNLNTLGNDVLRMRTDSLRGLDMVHTDLNSTAKDYIIDIDMPKHVRTMMPARDRGMLLNNTITTDRDVMTTRKVARVAQPMISTVNTHTANGIVDMKTLSNTDMTNVRINGVVANDCLTGCATSVKGLMAPMGLNKPVNGLIKDQNWTRFNK